MIMTLMEMLRNVLILTAGLFYAYNIATRSWTRFRTRSMFLGMILLAAVLDVLSDYLGGCA